MKKKILFVVIFVILGLLVSQIKLSPIVGAKGQAFTPLEFLGPTAGMFLGPFFGAIGVFFVKLFETLPRLFQEFDVATFVRLFPIMFAAIYFGLDKARRSHKLILIIPLAAIFLFVLHPEGQKVWFFSLFWLIPIIAFFKKERLIFNALGSTFTQHSVGAVAFLYAFNIPAPVWVSLIPVVIVERGLFAIGIWASYLVLNSILEKLVTSLKISSLASLVNPNYTLSKKFFRFNA